MVRMGAVAAFRVSARRDCGDAAGRCGGEGPDLGFAAAAGSLAR